MGHPPPAGHGSAQCLSDPASHRANSALSLTVNCPDVSVCAISGLVVGLMQIFLVWKFGSSLAPFNSPFWDMRDAVAVRVFVACHSVSLEFPFV